MPELVRSITARLREFVHDRRCAKRYPVRLSCQVELAKASTRTEVSGLKAAGLKLETLNTPGSNLKSHIIEGHTRDVSSDGIALILPAIRIGDHYLAGEHHPLLVRLQLPESVIEMHTVAVRYDSFTDEDQEAGYIVGARITQLGQEGRAQYVEFLNSLAQR
jgi:hypothetical protein